MEGFLIWIIFGMFCGLCAGAIAGRKGRSPEAWFALGLLLGPFVFIVAALPPVIDPETIKKCPACAETVKREAKKCRFCGHEFEEDKTKPSDEERIVWEIPARPEPTPPPPTPEPRPPHLPQRPVTKSNSVIYYCIFLGLMAAGLLSLLILLFSAGNTTRSTAKLPPVNPDPAIKQEKSIYSEELRKTPILPPVDAKTFTSPTMPRPRQGPKWIYEGSPRHEVERLWGKPDSETSAPDGDKILIYKAEATKLILRNNQVLRIVPLK